MYVFYYILFFVFPTDVISIQKTGEHFRLIYDVKGRFTIHRITPEEAKVIYSLCIHSFIKYLKLSTHFLIIVQVVQSQESSNWT